MLTTQVFGWIAAFAALTAGATDFGNNADGFHIDPAKRSVVNEFFNTVYIPTMHVPPNFTGNLATCDKGTIDPAYREAVLTQLNYYRAMAGVAANIRLDDQLNNFAQAGALVIAANNLVTHQPTPTEKCFSAEGAEGAAADIGGLAPPNNTIDLLMNDYGPANVLAGHRMDMINRTIYRVGLGFVPQQGENGASSVKIGTTAAITDPVGQNPNAGKRSRDLLLTWPNRGFIPSQFVVGRWTINALAADVDKATVKVYRDGVPVQVKVDIGANGDDGGQLVFTIENRSGSTGIGSNNYRFADDPPLTKDVWYRVVVEGIVRRSTLNYPGDPADVTYPSHMEYSVMVYNQNLAKGGRDDDVMMDWAEASYPDLFPGKQESQLIDKYYARCYGNGNCVGNGTDGNTYVYYQGELLNLGDQAGWIAKAKAAGLKN